MCVVPVADGALTSHKPVAKDEVTRVPKTTRTHFLACVEAYILYRTQLNEIEHHGWASPSHLIVKNT